MAYALGSSVYYAYRQQGLDASELYHPAILSAINSDARFAALFATWFPILAVLPAGFSLAGEQKAGTDIFLMTRAGARNYYSSKLLAGFLVSFLTFTIPFLLEVVFHLIIFPQGGGNTMTGWPMYSPTYLEYSGRFVFGGLYRISPYLYYAVHLLLLGMFAGCGAVFVLGISTFRLKFQALLFVQLYLFLYVVGQVAPLIFDYTTNLNWYLLAYDAVSGKKPAYYIGLMMVMLVAGCLLTAFNFRRGVGKVRGS